MLRLQVSWLMETIMNNYVDVSPDPKWYFPCLWKFTALEWLSLLNHQITINVPVHSQAILFNSWFSNSSSFPDTDMMKAFNQTLSASVDLISNPFKDWENEFFNASQLSYLKYWREAAGDIRSISLRDSFYSIVYQVMNYWLTNNKNRMGNYLPPNEVFAMYYQKYKDFRGHLASFKITEYEKEELQPKDCSNLVFNLIFSDEDYLEDEALFLYNAWLGGYSDLKESKRNFTEKINPFAIELGNTTNLEFYKEMTAEAKTVSFCWSGTGISISLYKRVLVKPLQDLLSEKFKHNKLVYKAINPSKNVYDYILLFY